LDQPTYFSKNIDNILLFPLRENPNYERQSLDWAPLEVEVEGVEDGTREDHTNLTERKK
jgi:hypothetical protein